MGSRPIKANGAAEAPASTSQAGASTPAENNGILDSWKEIACYLERDVRTVQRWEKVEGLPVHRHVHEKQGTVFAYRSEIDQWRRSRETEPAVEPPEDVVETDVATSSAEPAQPEPAPVPVVHSTHKRLILWVLGAAITVGVLVWVYVKITTGGTPFADRPVSVAVLPFENLSADASQEYFSDGMTEEVVVQLGKMQIAGLHPIAVSSSSTYKNSKKPLQQIAAELGAQYVVQGSVRRAGDQVRISAHLVRAKDDLHIWDENYDHDLRNVLALQAEVAEAIAHGVTGNLSRPRSAKQRALNPDAYEAYLRGRFFWNKRSPEEILHAMEEFKKAIAIDPTYAPAYVGMADCYTLLGSAQMGVLPPRDAMPVAKDMALKALSLDPNLAEAHASLAHVTLIYDRDGDGAEREFLRAIELNPGYATAHQWYALYLSAVGRTADALKQLNESKRLDPLSPAIHTALAEAYYFDRQSQKAIDESQKALEIDPNFTLGYLNMGRALEQLRRYDEAIAAYEKGRVLSRNGPAMTTMVARAYALKGNKTKTRELLRYLLDMPKSGPQSMYVPSIYIASIYNSLGEDQKALEYLEKALDERCEYLIYLDRDSMADPQRNNPRFKQILAEARLKGKAEIAPPKSSP